MAALAFCSFDDPDFDRVGTTLNIDDWLAHTPRSVLAKNFGVDPSVFDGVPSPNPWILNATVGDADDRDIQASGSGGSGSAGQALQDGTPGSWVYRTLSFPGEKVPGGGGEVHKIDSTNFPASTTIAATFVRLRPGGLRELHWHPNVSGPSDMAGKTDGLTMIPGRGVALLPLWHGASDGVYRQRERANVRPGGGRHCCISRQFGVS